MSDIVTLDINTYNSLKADSVRANMIVDHLFRTAFWKQDMFEWDILKLNEVLEIAYPKRYANEIAKQMEESHAQ